jgi:hypothetical protein
MPWADSAATAKRWATDRAIDGWVFLAGDFPVEELGELTSGLLAAKSDGASILLVVPPGITPAIAEAALAAVVAEGAIELVPEGFFNAIVAAGLRDVRRVGVVGRSAAVVSAGLRAGAGVVIAVAPTTAPDRPALLRAQPDALIEPREFGAFAAARYGSDRTSRQRVLLNPGPAVVSDRVHRGIGGPDLCHREPEAPSCSSGSDTSSVGRPTYRKPGPSSCWPAAGPPPWRR